MGTRKVEQGPVGERVAANVRAVRTGLRLSLTELSDRLSGIGRPILPTGIAKIESGDRRVDVDDLVALAIALEVTPNRLMLPGTVPTPEIPDELWPVTEKVQTWNREGWAWACGERPLVALPIPARTSPSDEDVPEYLRPNEPETVVMFSRRNRPHDPLPEPTPLSYVAEHEDVLAPVGRAAVQAVDAGVKESAVVDYVRVATSPGFQRLRTLAERQQDDQEGDDDGAR